jgi:hypothetical protein
MQIGPNGPFSKYFFDVFCRTINLRTSFWQSQEGGSAMGSVCKREKMQVHLNIFKILL